MPISTIYTPDFYDGNGVDTTFVFDWRILAKSDVVVKVLTVATEAVVTLVLDTDYTIADEWVDNEDGGEIDLTLPLATGKRIWLIRETAKTQLVNLLEGSPFPAATVTKVFDRLTMMIQELKYLSRMALKFRAVSTFVDVDVPDPQEALFLSWINNLLVNRAMVEETDESTVGAEETITLNATTFAVVFGTPADNTNYQILSVGPNWLTSWFWSAKTVNGFTINFSNPAPASAKASWRVRFI